MSEFGESFPTISGPGSYLAFLIFFALLLTNENTQLIATNWQFAVALVAISIPASVFITQIYHALFTKFGFNKLRIREIYPQYENIVYELAVLIDYFAHKRECQNKEYQIIRKRAAYYHLQNMLKSISILFSLSYVIIIFFLGHSDAITHVNLLGYLIVIFLPILFFFIFNFASEKNWKLWNELNLRFIEDNKEEFNDWLNRQHIKEREASEDVM